MNQNTLFRKQTRMQKLKKMSVGDIVFEAGKQLVMIVFGILILYPLFFVFMTSLKVNLDVLTDPFIITRFRLENYVDAWVMGHVGTYFFNSVYVAVITMIFQLIIILGAAYAFGKLKPWGSGILFTIFLTALFVTPEMTTVPNFMLLRTFGLTNTRWGLILPYTATGLILGIYIATNFVRGLPKELDEAALIDGASIFDILIKVDLPLIKPVVATILIFNFQAVWSEFYWALIVIRSDAIKTLPLGLINFQSQFSSNYGVLSAGLTILMLPVLLFYLSASRQFISGISVGALKG